MTELQHEDQHPCQISHVLVIKFVLIINQYTNNMHLGSKVCNFAIMNHVRVSVAAEVLDSCKKVENQLVSFAAVGVVMDEEAVQEAISTCQAADKLIQVSHGVATSPHSSTHSSHHVDILDCLLACVCCSVLRLQTMYPSLHHPAVMTY